MTQLTVVEFLIFPFLSAALLFLLYKVPPRVAQYTNVALNIVWAVLCFKIYQESAETLQGSEIFHVVFLKNWMPFLKSSFILGIDSLNFPLLVLNVFLSLTLSFYVIGKDKLGSGYLGLFFMLNGASVGALLAADAFLFYLFWEFMLIPMYLLIGRWGSKNRQYAALKFFAFTMAGSLFMLASILGLAYVANSPSLAWHDLSQLKLGYTGLMSLQALLFLGFLIAFAVKIPIWPLHTWLPDAHTEAPTGGSVILAGILLKLGVFGISRWCLPLFPQAARAYAPLMLTLACIGIVLGAFSAWKQSDIKRMIAYSSVSHLGFMVLGLFALTAEGLQGAMFQNLAHGLSTGALFLIFGMIYDRTHTRELSQYGGMALKNGWVATLFIFSAMASIGLPGLPGFVGEFLILSGTYKAYSVYALVALSGVLLGAIYMLTLVKKMNYGAETVLIAEHRVTFQWNEWVALVPFILAMILLGLHPQFILGTSNSAAITNLINVGR